MADNNILPGDQQRPAEGEQSHAEEENATKNNNEDVPLSATETEIANQSSPPKREVKEEAMAAMHQHEEQDVIQVEVLDSSIDSADPSATEELNTSAESVFVSDLTLVGVDFTIQPEQAPSNPDQKAPTKSPRPSRTSNQGAKMKGYYSALTKGYLNVNKTPLKKLKATSKTQITQRAMINQLKENADTLAQENKQLEGAANRMSHDLNERDITIRALKDEAKGQSQELHTKDSKITALETLLSNLKQQKEVLCTQVTEKDEKTRKIQEAAGKTAVALENKNKKLKQEIQTLEGNVTTLTRENSQLKERKPTTQSKKADELVKSNKALKEENDALVLQVQTQKQETSSNALRIVELEVDVAAAEAKAAPLAGAHDTDEKIQELEIDLQDAHLLIASLYEKIQDEEDVLEVPAVTEAPAAKPKGLYIADSNRALIGPKLTDKVDWEQTSEIYTVDMLTHYLEEETQLDEYSIIVIMQGTNDVKNGYDGMKAAKKLARTVKSIQQNLPQTMVYVTEIPPPQANPRKNSEQKLFNLALNQEHLQVIHTERGLNRLPIEVVLRKDDGIHLLERAAAYIAGQTNLVSTNLTMPSLTDTTKEPEQDSISWEIQAAAVGQIVGKGGRNSKRIEDDLKVKISIGPMQNNGLQAITVMGPAPQIEIAAQEITEITNQHTHEKARYDERMKETSRIECRYNMTGTCPYGTRCKFAHSPRDQTLEELPSRHMAQKKSPVRHRATSPPRHREYRRQEQPHPNTTATRENTHGRHEPPQRYATATRDEAHRRHESPHTHTTATRNPHESHNRTNTHPHIKKDHRSRSPLYRR